MPESRADLSLRPDGNVSIVEVDYLIVGAGPAGASLGCFLGRCGTLNSREILPL